MTRHRPWSITERESTPRAPLIGRREFLRLMGLAGAGVMAGVARASSLAPGTGGTPASPASGPSRQLRPATARRGPFLELGESEDRVRHAAARWPAPGTLQFAGLVQRERTVDVDDLRRTLPHEDRIYRHRCVEGWSAVVPWRGVPLARLVALASPLSSARYVSVVSASGAEHAPNQESASWYPWPYREGCRLDEALHELAFAATGAYGSDLTRREGAPLRLLFPWKYAFKSAKAIVRLEFVRERPSTFWTAHAPDEYGFLANVNPRVPHPRWSQAEEHPLGSDEPVPTRAYNGYGEWVASLYDRTSETFRS